MATDGDIRVLIVLDLVLSFVFSAMVVAALQVAGISEFTWRNVLLATAFMAVLTYFVVLRK